MKKMLSILAKILAILICILFLSYVWEIIHLKLVFNWYEIIVTLLPSILVLTATILIWFKRKVGGVLFIVTSVLFIFFSCGKHPIYSLLIFPSIFLFIGILFVTQKK